MTLLELLAVVAIIGLIAAVALVNFRPVSRHARERACYVIKGEIEVQAQLWHRNRGVWPAADMSDIGADPLYFPEGLPACPVDGTAYSLDATTHRVIGHEH